MSGRPGSRRASGVPGVRAASGREKAPLPPGFGAIWTCVALDLVGFGIVLPILPLYAERFGASPTTAGALVASFSLAQLVFAPIMGRVSDRIGRKPVLVVSLVGTAVGSLLTGLAGSLWLLFAGRLVDGASGASVSVAQASVADVAPPGQRARLLGLLGAAFGVGFVAGPAIGALAALGNDKLPFLLAAAIAAVNAVVAVRRLPETHPRLRAHSHAPLVGGADATTPGAQAGTDRGRWGLALVAFLSLAGFSAFEATFALFGEERFGFSLASTGAVFAAIGILISLVQVGAIHPTVERLGERGALLAGLALNGIGLLVLAPAQTWPVLVTAVVCLTVGQGLITPTLSSIVAHRAGEERRGGALGVQQAAGGLARVVGPVAGGAAFQHIGIPAPYVGAAALVAAALLVARRAA